LVNGDEWLDVRQIAKIVNEFAELRRALDVAAEQDEATRLKFSEASGSFGVQICARDAHEEELAEEFGGGHKEVNGSLERI
jgi:hypothetical protein